MTINPYSIGPSISGILILILGLYVFLKNPKDQRNQSFLFSYSMVALWLSFYSILYNINTHNHSILNYYKIAYCGINFIAIAFFTHITLLIDLKWTRCWNILNYFYGTIISVLILKTNLIISGLHTYYFGLYPKAGILHPAFLVYFIFLILIQMKFLIDFAKNNPQKINQTKYILLGYIMMCFASFDFLPNYGFEFYPLGFIFSLFYAVLVSYSIIKYELLDIKVVIRKSLIYSVFITCLTLIYIILILLSEHYFKGLVGYQTLAGSIITSIAIALIFIPLRNKIQDIIDHLFFKGSHIQIATENELLRREIGQNEKLKTIAIFASGMAHEIKNPLTTIKTFAEYLPSKSKDPEFINKFVPIVNKEVDRINELVHDLMEYSKPSPLSLKPTTIHKIITDTLDLLNNQLVTKNISVIKEFDESQQTFEPLLDPKQIKQAFLNIFINAIDALEPNGHLRITTERHKDKLIVKITDTGCGITKEDLPHIFDPFFTKKEKGTGLGLSITHGIIKEHGGKIFAESEVGRGTTFRIELPMRS